MDTDELDLLSLKGEILTRLPLDQASTATFYLDPDGERWFASVEVARGREHRFSVSSMGATEIDAMERLAAAMRALEVHHSRKTRARLF